MGSTHLPPTFDPREEPGALAAHAGICAGGEEQSSSLATIGRIEIPQCSDLLCYDLGGKRRSGLAAPRSIQNNSGLPQGPAHPLGGRLSVRRDPL